MAGGWGCQYLTKTKEHEEWCRRLEHPCDPGCNGCVLYGDFLFSKPDTPSNAAFEKKKAKKRSDDPFGRKG